MKKKEGNCVVIDSISHLTVRHVGKVIVCGSHGGRAAAEYMLTYKPKAVVFNDAGVGKQRAGICALEILQPCGIPGVAVSTRSARIGEGWDTYYCGEVSFVNGMARLKGIRRGMKVKAVVKRLAA